MDGYKQNAKKDGRTFRLSPTEFYNLVSGECEYCGRPPEKRGEKRSGRLGHWPWNGVDRLDNKKGYTPENCITCCQECNFIRGCNLTVGEMRAVGAVLREIRRVTRGSGRPPGPPPGGVVE